MSLLVSALTMEHKETIQNLISRLQECNGAIKLLYRMSPKAQVIICNGILNKNNESILAAKKIIES